MASPPRTLDRRQTARRKEIVEQLLPVVEHLLDSEESYLELSVETIIREAAIGRSTFYRYFQDKNDLLLALGKPALAEIVAAAREPWQLPPEATRRDLTGAMRRTIEAYRPHITLINAMVEVSAYNTAVKEQFQAGFEAARAVIAEQIREGQRGGYVRRDLEPDETAGWMTWMAERGMYQLVPGAGEAELTRLIDSFTGIFWYTIYEGQGRKEA